MANEKMTRVKMTMVDVMVHVFSKEYLGFVFGGKLNPIDVIDQLTLVLIKDAYHKTAEKHSMKYFFEKYGIDETDQKMRYSRIQSFVMKHRKREYDIYMEENQFFPEMEELLPPDMSDMKNKLDGYKLTEMNFFETTTILENEFTKAVTEHRLTNSKKISNDRFRDILAEYDEVIKDLKTKKDESPESTVFSHLAAFTLEWKYPFHFLYRVAKEMEKAGKSSFDDQKSRLVALCGNINTILMTGYAFSGHSRMLSVRDRYVRKMISEPSDSESFEYELRAFIEGIGLVSCMYNRMTIDDIMIRDWFINNTDMKDWASFFKEYNVFSCIMDTNRDWTNKCIRNFRESYEMILLDKLT